MLLLRREVSSILPLCDVPGLSLGELWTMLVSFLLGERELSPFLGLLLLSWEAISGVAGSKLLELRPGESSSKLTLLRLGEGELPPFLGMLFLW